MPLRRALIGSVLTALVLAAGAAAFAARYTNQSGLAAGRFVWSPSLAPSGPVTILVSPGHGSAHVYREGVEIGIAAIAMAPAGEPAHGVHLVPESRAGGDAEQVVAKDLHWRGAEVVRLAAGASADASSATAEARLPAEFAELLHAATRSGGAVIIARERTGPQVFSAAGPFIDPIETGSISRVGRFAAPELSVVLAPRARSTVVDEPGSVARSDPMPARTALAESAAGPGLDERELSPAAATTRTALVLSRADLSAYVLRDGRIVDRLPIAVDAPTAPFGLHAAILIAPGTAAREARWLAFGLDDDAAAPHIATDKAAEAMRRVRFLDRSRTANLARELAAGTVVVLMDGHGPSATEPMRVDVALLASEAAGPRSAIPPEPQRAPPVPENIDKPEQISEQRQPASRARRSDRSTRARTSAARSTAPATKSRPQSQPSASQQRPPRRGPLDHREGWPHSMYWPY